MKFRRKHCVDHFFQGYVPTDAEGQCRPDAEGRGRFAIRDAHYIPQESRLPLLSMRTLIQNIKSLYQIRDHTPGPVKGAKMADLPCIDNAWLMVENDLIHSFGDMKDCPQTADEYIDASGSLVLPAWCDSHTHIVFAGSRENEFIDKIKGLSYEEIAAKGGGILNSAQRLQNTNEDDLYRSAAGRLNEVIRKGTGAIEIKSGYGLTLDAELKMLRVIRRLKENFAIPIKANFLGAHAYPPEYKNDHEGYLSVLINDMLPRIAGEGLADYVDAFCEQGFFSVDDTSRILDSAAKYGLKPKIHANQLNNSGGVQVGVKHQAVSVDHLECIGDEEIACLQNSHTIPTLLPSCSFFIRIPYAPARTLINAGLPVCLASDYNPGSTPSGSIPFVISLACIYLRMLPEEAINAVTINGAFAMEIQDQVGSITVGKKANLIITKEIPGLAYMPYAFGSDLIDRVMINGRMLN